jgi:hypothetical protein
MLLYLRAGVPIRVLLILLVILIWAVFFACCEASFRRGLRAKTSGV